ncbi:Pr6Pr family membrane protein [Muricauda sp. 334s03]|uniref:Pr6Pr family membrane protein n=1 Tax=Flagellimonas yonaguniensis TaxID=3031325 RepID=A0ABT5Y2W6_9FLAO|nr:Pr6Pr family membrane protein [[Muricauda] yonaguniensis]MDF0717798.1 Pr6Pr family membrane protein [[Muricauda] yonaguniensis]
MRRNFEILGLCMGWFAVLAQLYLMLQNREAGIVESLVRFVSYFTILTNTLVALFFTIRIFGADQKRLTLFHQRATPMALTVFIVVVGLVYQLVLRDIWNPTGLQMVVDELLHTIIPAFMYVYWLMFCARTVVTWKQISKWLLYPLGYLVFVMVRGHFSGFYPYPFFNVTELGWGATVLNVGLVFLLMLLIMAALFFLSKLLRPKQ